MDDPPFDDGADHETSALVLPATAVTDVGEPGMVAGVTELLVPDEVLVPTAFVAVTVNV